MKTLLLFFALVAAAFAQTAPVITTQPASVTVAVGSSATFTVVATGTAPLTYQWMKSGITIPDISWRKSTLTIDGVSTNDETDYACVVTNAAGSVTSAKAKLTISSVPPIVVVPPTAPAATVSIRFNKDGSTYFRPSPTSTLTVECGNGVVVIDVATGTVTLPDASVQPLDATATAWWLAVVNAFPEAKKQIKANP